MKTMEQKLKKLVKALKNPKSKVSKSFAKAIKEEQKKEQKTKAFFESKKFEKYLKEIKRHHSVDEEGLRYEVCPEVKLSAKQFMQVYNAIWANLKDKAVDETEEFPTSYISYRGYRWYMMMGQGTACWCTREKK